MRVFLYEFASAVGLREPPSLREEGWAMLSAVVEDFARIPGVEVLTLLHESFGQSPGYSCRSIRTREEESVFRELAGRADYTLVIAPECADLLSHRSRWVLEENGKLLGCCPEGISLSADKLALARHLENREVPTPPVLPCTAPFPAGIPENWFPAVCKPRQGAGSQATFLVKNRQGLEKALQQGRQEMPGADFIVQPFVPGQPASVAFLLGPARITPLPPCTQDLSWDGRFHYRGGELPLTQKWAQRALDLATKAVQAVPGLLGYVGVDLVLGEAADGSADFVIEINPRLTTSYLGLRVLARNNLAEICLKLFAGQRIPALAWHQAQVRFRSDGQVKK